MKQWSVLAGALGAEQTIFLPTKCLSLLEVLCKARPHHCILAADFDELPETTIAGKNAPLVASTVSPPVCMLAWDCICMQDL